MGQVTRPAAIGETQEAPPLDIFSSVAVMHRGGRDEAVARNCLAKEGFASIPRPNAGRSCPALFSQHVGGLLITKKP